MDFTILDRWGNYPSDAKNEIFLTWDDWNDFGFYTTFGIFYIDDQSLKHELGGVKIGFMAQKESDRVFQIGHKFNYVGDKYFSLGSSDDYYEKLTQLDPEIRSEILLGLNDIAKNRDLYKQVVNDPVVIHSFFRSVSPTTVTGQFRRMAEGGAKLTKYSFEFIQPNLSIPTSSLVLPFNVYPESVPPTNIHVLIGRNGVGKTHLINNMIDSLSLHASKQPEGPNFKFFETGDWQEDGATFANLISISFSAFDEMEPKSRDTAFVDGIKYSYIGLRQEIDKNSYDSKIKDPTALPLEFWESLSICKSRSLTHRWLQAVSTLESDPNFRQAGIRELILLDGSRDSQAAVLKTFRRLSSGHKIVLLTITRLIEKLQERSLVIMDEPEAHLHPPLLSAFIRAVSDLLISTNGVAIVATHSPVILQEVPKSCAWKLRRSGALMVAERLTKESFGENVGILTNDVFGLEVTESGYYKMLSKIIEENNYDYDAVLDAFGDQLGMEARSIIMATIASKKN